MTTKYILLFLMMSLLVPILFILSFVAQKTGNSWVAVIINTGIIGPECMAVTFGLVYKGGCDEKRGTESAAGAAEEAIS